MKKSFLGCIAALLFCVNVNANLLVSPTRAELDDKKHRSAVFSLVNKGAAKARYNIYFEDKLQLPAGGYQTLEDAEPVLAKYVRYSPRRVSLEPEEGTRVRMAARLPKSLPSAEYRSYIVFHQIPNTPEASTSDDISSDVFSLSVTAYMRISIPVILRVGEMNGEVSIGEDAAIKNDMSVDIVINRQGERSSYGDIELFIETPSSDSDAKLQSIGSVKNATIYTELTSRVFNVKLNQPIEKGAVILVRYSESSSIVDAKTVESTLVL
ncbi:hypothetical protein [Shewanella sp. UCD-KL12]|uniref:hypothetical protein n=1 Tax=Shewanella sp. UCD-KL12 TaxID=1917163 RepID=UPI0009713BC2|nr:hypothetical protein [Shewanella sp. UCD-KL12]